jgi:hypothetical protein
VQLINELKILSSRERVYDILKLERSQIRVSHNIANLVRVDHRTVNWLGSKFDSVL